MGWKEGVIVICAPFLPLCSCQLEKGGTQPQTINNSYTTEIPWLLSMGLLTLPTYPTGLHLFQLFSNTVGKEERIPQDVQSEGSYFKRTRISPLLNVMKGKAALVSARILLTSHCSAPPHTSQGCGSDLPPPILWAFALFFIPKMIKDNLSFCPSLNALLSTRHAGEALLHTKPLMTDEE